MTPGASSYLNVVSGHIPQLEFFSTKSSCIIPSQYPQVIIPELQEKIQFKQKALLSENRFLLLYFCV